nr:hypothetical protein B0A51_03435 [Rachicladosporium sp. CCFEE 5018]
MGWPYRFIFDISDNQKSHMRRTLDWYGFVAQTSVLLPLLAIQLFHIVKGLSDRRQRDAFLTVPSSPRLKHCQTGLGGGLRTPQHRWRIFMWWASEDLDIVGVHFGSKGGISAVTAWGAWLLLLCFLETGDNYLHLTKRFGIVAASQLPFHYLLSLKSPYSPIQMITQSSHETLNASHQLLGRLITWLLYSHAVLYLNLYVMNGLLIAKLKQAYVLCGVAGIIAFTVVCTTALAPVRRWSYRVFYVVHVVLATALLPVLFFHVSHIRVYMYETAVIYCANVGLRYFFTTNRPALLRLIPDTGLLEISVPLTTTTAASGVSRASAVWQPSQHAYVSLPGHAVSRTFRSNPYTVASVPSVDKQLRFVAHTLDGNTAKLAASLGGDEKPRDVTIEGPYGVTTHANQLLGYDRVLFFAGGVGGTFIVPLYRQLLSDLSPGKSRRRDKVSFVWAVRSKSETQWAIPESAAERDVFTDRLKVFLTRDEALAGSRIDERQNEDEEAIELQERKQLLSEAESYTTHHAGHDMYERGRPNVERIVEQCMMQGNNERVAVVVCGPKSLSRSLRAAIKPYVWRGRDVWFWDESFGY